MKKSKGLLLALAIGAVIGPAGLGQAASGSPEQQAACRPDVRRYCHKIPQNAGDNAFLACLQENRAKLSAPCRKVLESNGM
ncbi:cysteine rich repeat-containing protein [Rhodoblastus sp.]|uniref:cysteine rich repeat-containing protein n=1 Tax=Rhodoblastus sp. TaxID=1962975 RepID=UPI003F95CFDC